MSNHHAPGTEGLPSSLRRRANDVYCRPLSKLTDSELAACLSIEEMLTTVVDKSTEAYRIAVKLEIDSVASKSDCDALAALRAKRRALVKEYAAKVQALIDAEKVFGGDEVEDDDKSRASALLRLHGQPVHKAAEWSLRELGEPSKVSDIVDHLIKNNYATSSERKTLTNSLFVSMGRKSEFEKQPDSTWALREWEESE